MKRTCCFIIVILLRLNSDSVAQEYEDIKKYCSKLEKKFSIELEFEQFPKTTWKLGYKLASKEDYKKLHRYLSVFESEFDKYPKSFLENTKLAKVVFVKSLAYKNIRRMGIADFRKEIIIMDFLRGEKNKTYQKHVIHHEFYRMFEEEFNRIVVWTDDPAWNKLNVAGFRYGRGGSSEYTHPETGFVNLYSKSKIINDKGTIFSALFVKEEYEKLMEWSKEDRVLYQKKEYMKNFLRYFDKNFHDGYWDNLYGMKKSSVQNFPKLKIPVIKSRFKLKFPVIKLKPRLKPPVKKLKPRPKPKPKKILNSADQEKAAAALMRFAKVVIEKNRSAKAIKWLERILQRYPNTEVAKEAKKMLEEIK